MLSMSDPSADAGSDIVETYRSRLPPVAQAAQAIAEAANIVLGEAATTVGMQFEAEELRGLAARQDARQRPIFAPIWQISRRSKKKASI